jgi:hypothetical protein
MRIFSAFLVAVLMLVADGSCTRSHSRRDLTPPSGKAATSETVAPTPPAVKPTINVYIENSGSMDGYVKGVTEFEQVIYNYLSDIKIAKVADALNLNYINSEVLPYRPKNKAIKEEMDVLKDFIEKLEPSTFRTRGGKRGESDIADVLKDVLANTKKNTISLLITDGIFSPGSGKNADQYLVNQQIGIKNSFAAFLGKEKDAAVIVYQLSSQFDGKFYNKVNKPAHYRGVLPFYIYIIGNANHVAALCRAVPKSSFRGGGVPRVFSITTGNKEVKYAVNPSIGKFKRSRKDAKTTIEDLEKDSRTGKVKFAVNVDFSGLLLDEDYLLNSQNYENSSKYSLEVKPSATKGKNYTHTLTFSSDRVTKGAVAVKLKAARPAWIDSVNDANGIAAVAGKTYGIKYQLDGIFDAFTFNNKYYAEIKININ